MIGPSLCQKQGEDTPSLCTFAGETEPFNQFELSTLVDKVFEELKLEWSNQENLIEQYVAQLLKQYAREELQAKEILELLHKLYLEIDALGTINP